MRLNPITITQGMDVATAAIGKWHNGALLKAYTPTYRGFQR